MIAQLTILDQLLDIYYNDEWWCKNKMSYDEAVKYHYDRLQSGNIQVYQENGEVLGYYERYFKENTCILFNVYVKKEYRNRGVFKAMRKQFFLTMPSNITTIKGEKQKLGGKIMSANLKKEIYGK